MASSIGFNLLQVLFVVALAPLVAGVLSPLRGARFGRVESAAGYPR
jgi:hypothetical protein